MDELAGEYGVEVEDAAWGRECEVVDPDGNRVRVASAPGQA